MRFFVLGFWIALIIPVHGQDGLLDSDCPYDLNGDGLINYGEIVSFLSGYGVQNSWSYDYSGDGLSDFEDARIFSRYLGYQCPTPAIPDTSGYFLGLVLEPIDTLSEYLADGMDTLATGAITYRLYAEVTDPNVNIRAVWGDADHPLTLCAPDGIFISSVTNGFAHDILTAFMLLFPTLEKSSWWALDQAPEDNPEPFNHLLLPENGTLPDLPALMAENALALDSTLGEGWFRWGMPSVLPTSSTMKLLGQFTTPGQGGLSGTLNLELHVLLDDGTEAYEEVFGAAFQSPGVETPCEAGPDCPEGVDINSDGLVATSDLLQLLEDFGTVNSGPSDINGDGAVNVADVLALLGAFGLVCD
jgi:hypothetical protein